MSHGRMHLSHLTVRTQNSTQPAFSDSSTSYALFESANAVFSIDARGLSAGPTESHYHKNLLLRCHAG